MATMSDAPRKRGRPRATEPRERFVGVNLTEAEEAELDVARGSVALGAFIRDAALRWIRSAPTHVVHKED